MKRALGIFVGTLVGITLSLGASSGTAAPELSFARPVAYAAGDTPNAVTAADLDGDGKADLAATNESGNSVSILLNRGGGLFGAKRDYRTGEGPAALAVGDMNGDGRADVVTANEDADSVSVLLNTGRGHLGSKTDYRTGSGPLSLALGDLNGDGKLDVATANFGDGTASVLLNDGKGRFARAGNYRVKEAWAVAVGDLNGDGRPDLAVAGVTGVYVLFNKGAGTFASPVGYDTAAASYELAVGDVNADGKPDLVTASADAGAVSVLLNKGDGSFVAARTYATLRDAASVAISDLNGDGRPDLVVAANRADSVSVLVNAGDGSFASRFDVRTGGGPGGLAVSDVNGDRKPDLVTSGDADAVSVLINTTGASSPAHHNAPPPGGTIVFSSNGTGNVELYSIRSDGSRLGQLTRTSTSETRPMFSPDGRRIAFLRGDEEWVVNADGSRQRKVGTVENGDVAWAPNSRQLAFASEFVESRDAIPLAVVGLDGRKHVVVPRGRNQNASWSPDGKRLVFTREVGDRDDAMVVGADGRSLRTLRRDVGPIALWSPAGNLIAFTGKGLNVVRPDGHGARQLAWHADAFAWSPDGRRIAFVAAGRAYVVRVGGGSPSDITPDAVGRLSTVAWSPNGRWLVVRSVPPSVENNDGDLFVVATDGFSVRRIAVGAGYPFGADNQSPSWRPRGARPARLGRAPVRLSPSETASASSLRSVNGILGLAADGGRVAVLVRSSAADCAHVSVWAPGSHPIRFGSQEPCSESDGVEREYGPVALTGTRAAWVESSTSGMSQETPAELETATIAKPTDITGVDGRTSFGDGSDGPPHGAYLGSLHGSGDVLVYNTWQGCKIGPESGCTATGQHWHGFEISDTELWRLGDPTSVRVAGGSTAFEAVDVDAGRIVVLEPGGSVDVVGVDGTLMPRLLPRGLAQAAELSGSQLVVLTATGLQSFDLVTGLQVASRSLVSGKRDLAGFDDGVASYVEGRAVHVIRLADGHQFSVAIPGGKGVVFAQLTSSGLFTAYTLGKGPRRGRVDFISHAEVIRRLG
jgi:Tol biopolymer transport system component